MDPDKLAKSTTTDGQPIDPEAHGAPKPIDPQTGQHGAYYVLKPEERAKGWVRPLRLSYVHTGEKPTYPLRPLTDEEVERFAKLNMAEPYDQYEEYPEGETTVGRYWTKRQLTPCGASTTMSLAIAETYARDPGYYGATFCTSCKKHFPVAEFQWEDGTTVGS